VSRAELAGVPAPTLGGSLRGAATDFYYHSLRLVPLNVAWGAGLVALLVASVRAPAPLVVVLLGALALPTVALFRVAGGIVRGESVELSDGIRAARRRAVAAMGVALLASFAAFVLAVNAALGLANPGIIGWTLMTLAAWGLFALWTVALAFWALLTDPDRDLGVAGAARLASLLVVAHPVRLGGFGLIAGLLAALSVVLVMPVLTISVAFIALFTCHFVLPASDRLEAALATRTDAAAAR
jgi:hypothetical protein